MQEGVDGVKLWADRNKMELNAKKTKDMWSSLRNTVITLLTYALTIW